MPESAGLASWLNAYNAIPVNMKAYGATPKGLMDPETNLPWTKSKGFMNDIQWWAANRTKVSQAWSNWIL